MEESDVEVYGKIIAKDANSLEILYDRYESLLYNFIYKITQDKQSSEEVLQDVFMKIWNQKQDLIVARENVNMAYYNFKKSSN